MEKTSRKSNQGFIKTILIFVVALIAIEYFNIDVKGYFNIDVKGIVESDIMQSIISFTKGLFTNYVEPGLETVKEALPEGATEDVIDSAVENATSVL